MTGDAEGGNQPGSRGQNLEQGKGPMAIVAAKICYACKAVQCQVVMHLCNAFAKQ